MITRDDLTTVNADIEVDTSVWHNVETKDGRRFILSASNISPEDLDKMHPITVLMYMQAPEYMVESVVFAADGDWNIVGECGPECGKGICTRRIAQDREVGSIDRSYELLLDYLNS